LLFEERYITSPKSNLETLAACPTIADPDISPDIKMEFLMQELNREANTLGSKSIAAECTQASGELKVLLEQMREQVQNIE